MIKLFYGKKGMGKTKVLVDTANSLIKDNIGDVVFIDNSNQLMYDLKHEIRFINVSEFPISGGTMFLGFICGIISEDYDINSIFIDGLTYITDENVDSLECFFKGLKQLSEKFNINFYISATGELDKTPEFVKEFIG